ncbi:MAG: hypothetical protein ACRD3T_05170 [Terriglobia bacterium]
MFQMIDEEKPSADDRRMFFYKVAAFIAAIGCLGVITYLLATSHYLGG